MSWRTALYQVRKGVWSKRNQVIIALALAFIVANAAGAYYIGWYTTGEMDASFTGSDSDVIEVLGPISSPFIWTEDGVLRLINGVLNVYHDGAALDVEVGDITGAVALLLPDGDLIYDHAINGVGFTVEVGNDACILGVGERWTSDEYIPDYIIVALPENATTVIRALSISEHGEVAWQATIDGSLTMHSRTGSSRYVSVLFDTGEISTWTKSDPNPMYTYQVDDVIEMDMASNYAMIALTTVDEVVILQDGQEQRVELPETVHNLMVRYDRDHVYVQDRETVYDIHDGIYEPLRALTDGEWYVAPSVTDRLFVVNGNLLSAYHGIRGATLWTCDLGGEPTNIVVDASGTILLAWHGESLTMIDNENPPMGNSDLWLYFGIIMIAETSVVAGLAFSDKLKHMRSISPAVVALGTLICMSVAYLFPNQATVDWYGSLQAYVAIAGGIALISMTVGWYSQAGIGSFFYGFVTGLISSIPVAIVATYLLLATGHTFPEESAMFYSLFNTFKIGMVMGLIAGAIAYAASLIDEM